MSVDIETLSPEEAEELSQSLALTYRPWATTIRTAIERGRSWYGKWGDVPAARKAANGLRTAARFLRVRDRVRVVQRGREVYLFVKREPRPQETVPPPPDSSDIIWCSICGAALLGRELAEGGMWECPNCGTISPPTSGRLRREKGAEGSSVWRPYRLKALAS